jgi:diaminopimelate epimerase
MRRPFHKLSGAGNDFVLVTGSAGPALARRLCDRLRGVGADGLLAVERRRGGASLSYFNADGSRAFCGNGSRCAAWWAYRQGWTGGSKEFTLATTRGALRARITGARRAAVQMPAPRNIRLSRKLKALGRNLTLHSLDTGVPHAVLIWDDLESAPVLELGQALRRHKAFAPRGTNVDFVEFGRNVLRLRTYERGVEEETLACGTGVAAAAIVAFLLGRGKPPMRVRVRGGERLTVRFRESDLGDLWLEGPVTPLFNGTFVQ